MSRRQLLAAGVGEGAIKRMLSGGGLHRCHRGVYAVGHAGSVELGDETAALLACGENVVLSHWTAAAMWRLLAPNRGGVHITLGAGRCHSHTGITVHRTTRLDRRDRRFIDGLPVTSPARTLLDMAPSLTDRQLERALDQALATGIVRRAQVRDAVERLPGRKGAARLAALLDPRRPRTHTWSWGEETLLGMIRDADLPEPEVNYVWGDYVLDFYWVEYRVAVELDGYPYHSTRTALARDRRKEAALEAARIDLARVGYEQLKEQPLAVIARIVRKIEAARAARR